MSCFQFVFPCLPLSAAPQASNAAETTNPAAVAKKVCSIVVTSDPVSVAPFVVSAQGVAFEIDFKNNISPAVTPPGRVRSESYFASERPSEKARVQNEKKRAVVTRAWKKHE